MKIFIFCDMEGISGIFRREQVISTEPEFMFGRKYMTMDINACIQGCFAGGATEIIVRDGHGGGRNVLWHELDSRAQYILGDCPERFPDVKDCDGVILLGYHAMAGTPEAILEHTFSSASWQNLWLNGRKIGEFEYDARYVGDYGVPVIMTSGDDKTCAEAKNTIPEVEAVQVKRATSLSGGIHLSMEKAHEAVRAGAARAVKCCKAVPPLCTPGPFTLRLELVERTQMPRRLDDAKIIDGRTYEVSGETFTEARIRFQNT